MCCFELFLIVVNCIWKKIVGFEYSFLILRFYKELIGLVLFCFVIDVVYFLFCFYVIIGGLCVGEMGFVAEHVAFYFVYI